VGHGRLHVDVAYQERDGDGVQVFPFQRDDLGDTEPPGQAEEDGALDLLSQAASSIFRASAGSRWAVCGAA